MGNSSLNHLEKPQNNHFLNLDRFAIFCGSQSLNDRFWNPEDYDFRNPNGLVL